MDSKTLIGIFLILLVTFLWMFISQPQRPPHEQNETTTTEERAGKGKDDPSSISSPPASPSQTEIKEAQPEISISEPVSAIHADSLKKTIFFENNLVAAQISSEQGGSIIQWKLNKYDHYQGGKVDLIYGIDFHSADNGLEIELRDRDGNILRLNDFNLKVDLDDSTSLILDENNPTAEIEFYLPIENGRILKKYIFHYNKYSADVIITFEGLQSFLGPQRWYSVRWINGLLATEENTREDYDYARAYAYQNGELTEFDVSEDKEKPKSPPGPMTNWTGVCTKYFLASIIPYAPEGLTVELSGVGLQGNNGLIKVFSTSLGVTLPAPMPPVHSDTFTVYLGPLSYDVLKSYDKNLEKLVMSKGYEEYLRPISIPILIAFKFLHSFIPNYGWVIIIFSILIKLVLHPLTKKSYQSMSEMQYIQPQMTKLREKYKSDPQRLNREMMKLYKDHGINPLGGCLPTLLQMPLLFALFIVFRSTIQLRGEPFILWITDLSRPDTLFTFNFSIPFLGDSFHVLPFLMGATSIWQSKMTMTDPKQKMMIYFMPIFLIFIFYTLPSGLNLYYAVFNILSMFQTRMIKKKMHPNNGADKENNVRELKESNKVAPQRTKSKKSRKKKG